ncbi:MAG: hypothetical protein DME62_14355 [Verrucomicrobia bacterium]|nr:MAG: hypothetical protein DME62_14355 [Verrucomicrobiota bacterium]
MRSQKESEGFGDHSDCGQIQTCVRNTKAAIRAGNFTPQKITIVQNGNRDSVLCCNRRNHAHPCFQSAEELSAFSFGRVQDFP